MEIRSLAIGPEEISVSLLGLSSLEEISEVRFLTLCERERYALLKGPKRRKEYLGARICLKESLVKKGVIKGPLECQIDKDSRGRPYVDFQVYSTTQFQVYSATFS